MCSKPYAAPCVALLYWFVLGCSLTRHEGRKTMWQKQCGSKLSRAWSLSLTCDFCKDAEQRLGGAGKVVCIDKACFHLQEEAFQKRFPRKKQGRHKANHFGNDRARPANSEGRRKNPSSTILDRSQKTLPKHIQKQVGPGGTLIFTEYVRRCVNHKAPGILSPLAHTFGDAFVVSTNSAEEEAHLRTFVSRMFLGQCVSSPVRVHEWQKSEFGWLVVTCVLCRSPRPNRTRWKGRNVSSQLFHFFTRLSHLFRPEKESSSEVEILGCKFAPRKKWKVSGPLRRGVNNVKLEVPAQVPKERDVSLYCSQRYVFGRIRVPPKQVES